MPGARSADRAPPVQRVRIIEHIRANKWKAEWVDPNPGLVHYVESGQLVCLWKEHKAFLKEESEAQRLREHNERNGYMPESPLTKAAEQVFETVGDDIKFYNGILSGSSDALERVKVRAGMAEQPTRMWRTSTVRAPFTCPSTMHWNSPARSAHRNLQLYW